VVAGAALGVLGVLLTLFALVERLDERYVPRRENAATLSSIDRQLAEIKTDLRAHVGEKPRP
jgi:hypothetical protein